MAGTEQSTINSHHHTATLTCSPAAASATNSIIITDVVGGKKSFERENNLLMVFGLALTVMWTHSELAAIRTAYRWLKGIELWYSLCCLYLIICQLSCIAAVCMVFEESKQHKNATISWVGCLVTTLYNTAHKNMYITNTDRQTVRHRTFSTGRQQMMLFSVQSLPTSLS